MPGAQPEWVARLIERLEKEPEQRIRDRDLLAAGVEPERARRHFQQRYGMTFHAWPEGSGSGPLSNSSGAALISMR